MSQHFDMPISAGTKPRPTRGTGAIVLILNPVPQLLNLISWTNAIFVRHHYGPATTTN